MSVFVTILILLFTTLYATSKWQLIAPKKFDITRSLDKTRVNIGEEVQITTTMINKKWIPLPWVSVFTYVPQSFLFNGMPIPFLTAERLAEYNIVTSFLFYERVKRHDKFTCNKRGYYKLDAPTVTFGDLFGFAKAEITVQSDVALYVYPRQMPLQSFRLIPNTLQGPISVKRWIMPDPIQAIGARAYTHDDSFNMIDWKASAKLGELQVKKMDHTADISMMVLLDVQTAKMHWNEIDRDSIEKGVEIAASLIKEAFSLKIPVGFCANSVDAFMRNAIMIKPANTPNQKVQILDALAMVTPFRGVAMEKLMREATIAFNNMSLIILITSFLSVELIETLNQKCKQGARIKLILTKASTNTAKLDRKIECYHSLSDEVEGLKHEHI